MWKDKLRVTAKVISFGLNGVAIAVLALPLGIDIKTAFSITLGVVALDLVVETVEWFLMKPSREVQP